MWELTAATVQAESCDRDSEVADPPADFRGAAELEADVSCDRDSEVADRTGTAGQPPGSSGGTDWKFRTFGIQHKGYGYWYSNSLGVCRQRPY